MAELPKVTQAEFEKIECNRCGACCTKLWLPSPLKLATYLSARDSMTDPPEAWLQENDRFIAWLSALEPTGKVNESTLDENETHQYSCTRFIRLEDGSGFCTAHEDRPSACRGFPYGQPVHEEDFADCSYNVEIIKESPVASGWRQIRRGMERLTNPDKLLRRS